LEKSREQDTGKLSVRKLKFLAHYSRYSPESLIYRNCVKEFKEDGQQIAELNGSPVTV
jgi:hypothetical protein